MEGANEAPPPAPVHMEDSTAKPSLETGGRHPRASALNTDLGSDSKLGSSCTGPADRCTWLGPAGPGEAVGGRARTKAAVDTAPQGSQRARTLTARGIRPSDTAFKSFPESKHNLSLTRMNGSILRQLRLSLDLIFQGSHYVVGFADPALVHRKVTASEGTRYLGLLSCHPKCQMPLHTDSWGPRTGSTLPPGVGLLAQRDCPSGPRREGWAPPFPRAQGGNRHL